MVCCMAAVMDMAGLCGCSRLMLWRLRSSSSSAVVTDSVSLLRCRAMAPKPAAMQHPNRSLHDTQQQAKCHTEQGFMTHDGSSPLHAQPCRFAAT